jgi:hypothetical protein
MKNESETKGDGTLIPSPKDHDIVMKPEEIRVISRISMMKRAKWKKKLVREKERKKEERKKRERGGKGGGKR